MSNLKGLDSFFDVLEIVKNPKLYEDKYVASVQRAVW